MRPQPKRPVRRTTPSKRVPNFNGLLDRLSSPGDPATEAAVRLTMHNARQDGRAGPVRQGMAPISRIERPLSRFAQRQLAAGTMTESALDRIGGLYAPVRRVKDKDVMKGDLAANQRIIRAFLRKRGLSEADLLAKARKGLSPGRIETAVREEVVGRANREGVSMVVPGDRQPVREFVIHRLMLNTNPLVRQKVRKG